MKAGETMVYLITMGGRKNYWLWYPYLPFLHINLWRKLQHFCSYIQPHGLSMLTTFPLGVKTHFSKSILEAGYMN
jgi:hypothetical protein